MILRRLFRVDAFWGTPARHAATLVPGRLRVKDRLRFPGSGILEPARRRGLLWTFNT